MALNGITGFARLVKASQYSWQGVRSAYKFEAAFRLDIWVSMILIPLGLWLGHDGIEKALLMGVVLLLPLVELLNSSIEAVVDRIGKEHHELSARAKDMGSAAVAFTLILIIVVWILVLTG